MNSIRRKCSKQKYSNCSGAVNNNQQATMALSFTKHNHEADNHQNQAQKVQSGIKVFFRGQSGQACTDSSQKNPLLFRQI